MTTILKGGELAARLRAEIAQSIAALAERSSRAPVLVTVLIGTNASAEAYRNSIARSTARVGIEHRPITLPGSADEPALIRTLHGLNADPEVTGVLVLMPLPDLLRVDAVLEHLSPLKDVDGITPTNAGRLHLGLPSLRPSTPQGGIELLDHYGIAIEGKVAIVIGRSNVVGRPMASLLMQRHATVTICHRRTRDLASHTRRADIVAVAAGHPGLVTPEMIQPGAVVLDFGVNVVGDRLVGDADFDGLQGKVDAITPVPGGTGPVTAMVLARNTVAAGFAALGGSLDYVDVMRTFQPGVAAIAKAWSL
ncbi:MAG: bifunctional 5,10-methylenetetrahydrofolate dehydrogenase/5,10-methenyltetrahydrofolate cyclohydrolase [Thermomicrobiales bacterium]